MIVWWVIRADYGTEGVSWCCKVTVRRSVYGVCFARVGDFFSAGFAGVIVRRQDAVPPMRECEGGMKKDGLPERQTV